MAPTRQAGAGLGLFHPSLPSRDELRYIGSMTRTLTAHEMRRKERAERILIYHYFESRPLHECWYRAVSGSRVGEEEAAELARRERDWYCNTFQVNIDMALYLLGLDEFTVVAELAKTITSANHTYRDKATGELRDSGIPDARARLNAIKRWNTLRGYGLGRRPRETHGARNLKPPGRR